MSSHCDAISCTRRDAFRDRNPLRQRASSSAGSLTAVTCGCRHASRLHTTSWGIAVTTMEVRLNDVIGSASIDAVVNHCGASAYSAKRRIAATS